MNFWPLIVVCVVVTCLILLAYLVWRGGAEIEEVVNAPYGVLPKETPYRMYEIVQDFRKAGITDIYKEKGFEECYRAITRFIDDKQSEIVLAWWAEHGFEPGNAVLVHDGGEVYIREATPEENLRRDGRTLRDVLCEWPEDAELTNAESNAVCRFVEYVEKRRNHAPNRSSSSKTRPSGGS